MFRPPPQILDIEPFLELKDSDPKTIAMTLGKAMIDMKVLATVFSFFFIIYAIGYDTMFKPSMEALRVRDEAVKQQLDTIKQKEDQKDQFTRWERDTSNVITKMVRLKEEQSAKVISLKESEKVVSIARSPSPTLPEPHNKREGVALTAMTSEVLSVLNGITTAGGGDAPPPPAPVEGASPGSDRGGGNSLFGADGQATTNVAVEKYDYKITINGTYPAVVDFVNKIVALDNLVAIKEITIERTNNDAGTFPDPEKFPDYPVKVTMNMIFSIYLYVPSGVGSSG